MDRTVPFVCFFLASSCGPACYAAIYSQSPPPSAWLNWVVCMPPRLDDETDELNCLQEVAYPPASLLVEEGDNFVDPRGQTSGLLAVGVRWSKMTQFPGICNSKKHLHNIYSYIIYNRKDICYVYCKCNIGTNVMPCPTLTFRLVISE